MALTRVAAGELAAVVTTLERREPPAGPPPASAALRLERWAAPSLAAYRALFRRVGERWLWYSRLALDDAALAAVLADPGVEVHAALDAAGAAVGLVELDRRRPPACCISYFALIPELTGQGHGRWLMARALDLAWRPGVERVWLNTCTLDHPGALGFYRAQGFRATARWLETFPDPRLVGLLPRDAAPQVALLE